MKSVSVIFIIIILLGTVMTNAQTSGKKICLAQQIQDGIMTIDGTLNEPSWKMAHWDHEFIQNKPHYGREASQKTYFAVLHDNKNIYVGMKMVDTSPDSIVSRLTRRDHLDGDFAGVAIDSYNDSRTAFVFSVSASSALRDYILSNDGTTEDATWNPVWWAGTSKDSRGWVIEMKIPLTQIRFEDSQEQIWGFQVFRYLFRNEETSLWQPISPKQSGFVSLFGKIKGITDIKPDKTADLTPYLVARTEQFEKEPDNPFRSSGYNNYMNIGLDAKIGLTNNFTMDLTINPDFGQVEADPSEVNLTTYETFLQEQRPFFIEGNNILNYKLNFGGGNVSTERLFYSRRIGGYPRYYPDLKSDSYVDMPEFTKILGAVKITGKTRNGWSVGLLESLTARENALIQGTNIYEKVAVEPFTNYAIGRFQKEFNEHNTYLGGMITTVNRDLRDEQFNNLHKSAYSAGLDFVHKWNDKNWQFETSVYGSTVMGSTEAILQTQENWNHLFQRPDADYLGYDPTRTSLSGYGGKILLGEYGGNWKFMNGLAWKSPGLELNDVGYMRESNTIQQIFWMGYYVYEPFAIFNNLYIDFNQWSKWDFGGNLTSPGGNINLNTTFRNYWNFMLSTNVNGQSLSARALRGGPVLKLPGNINVWTGISSNSQKKLTFDLGGFVDRGFVKSYSQSEGANLEIGYRPLKSLKFSFNPDYVSSKSELQYVTKKKFGNEDVYIFGTIRLNTLSASLRVNLNLTPELSLQYWAQPFIASGKYSGFKRITDSKAKRYADRFVEYSSANIYYDAKSEMYRINNYFFDPFFFGHPDFNVKEFLSNLIFRWEFQPGSTLFFVWSQNRESAASDGSFVFDRDLKRLFNAKARNVLLAKLSYRIEPGWFKHKPSNKIPIDRKFPAQWSQTDSTNERSLQGEKPDTRMERTAVQPQNEVFATPAETGKTGHEAVPADGTFPEKTSNTWFAIQIFAITSQTDGRRPDFKGETAYSKRIDRYIKYFIGRYPNLESAERELQRFRSKFPGCFIVAFKDGEVIPIDRFR